MEIAPTMFLGEDEPDIEKMLRSVQPMYDAKYAQLVTQLGELRAALYHIDKNGSNGVHFVALNLQFGSTIDELKRRDFTVEPIAGRTAFMVSWLDPIDLG